jgi:hypothetical protein
MISQLAQTDSPRRYRTRTVLIDSLCASSRLYCRQNMRTPQLESVKVARNCHHRLVRLVRLVRPDGRSFFDESADAFLRVGQSQVFHHHAFAVSATHLLITTTFHGLFVAQYS